MPIDRYAIDNKEITMVRDILILDKLNIFITFNIIAAIVLGTPTESEILKCSIHYINYSANI